MAEVIHFPTGQRQRPEQLRLEANRVTFARECSQIGEAISKVGTLSPQDAETAARNLTSLLDQARDLAGVRLVDVAGAVDDWSADGVAAKRFDKLTLPRRASLSPEEYRRAVAKRRGRLQRRPRNFAKVASALAGKMDGRPSWRETELLVRLFRGTRIDRELQRLLHAAAAAAAEPANCWRELSMRLHELAAWVTREAGLHEHQRRLVSTRGRYDVSDRTCHPDTSSLLKHGPLNDNFEVWEEWPPVPSVLLFEELLADSVEAALTFEHTLHAGLNDRGADTPYNKRFVQAQVWREVRLAIGPADAVEEPSALFEVRTRVDISDETGPLKLDRPWLYLPSDNVRISGMEQEAELQLPDSAPCGAPWERLLAWPSPTDVRQHLQPEHNYAAWRLVTPELCSEMLGSMPGWTGPSRYWLRYDVLKIPTLSPEGTIGSIVEAALLSPDGPGLDRMLLEEAKFLVQLVGGYIDERRGDAATMHLRASAQWAGSQEGAE